MAQRIDRLERVLHETDDGQQLILSGWGLELDGVKVSLLSSPTHVVWEAYSRDLDRLLGHGVIEK